MFDYNTSDTELWRFSGVCSIHGDYIYRVRKDEKSVGCPVCSVNAQKAIIDELQKKQNQ